MDVKSYKLQYTSYKRGVHLLLDPGSQDGRLRFFVFDEGGKALTRYTFAADRKAIEHLLAKIESKLKMVKRSLKNIKGIIVVRGGESFSAVRGVHAIANALCWSLQIPSVVINAAPIRYSPGKRNPEKKEKTIFNAINKLRCQKSSKLLFPTYSRPPNITLPHKGN